MDYQEEQTQELEVLESIYPDELTIVSSQFPKIQFEIKLPLDLMPLDSSSFTADALTKDHWIVLNIKLPETYPDTVPVIRISCEQARKSGPSGAAGDSDSDEDSESDEEVQYDDNGNPLDSKLTNLPDQVEFEDYIKVLESQVESQADEDMLVGMQMCFALVSWLKESCEHYFQEQLAELERDHERKLAAREKEEQKKFRGTKVTRDSYTEWRDKFREETGRNERDARRKAEAHGGKLTGRQIFEQGLDGSEDVEED
ncbi:LANO_0H05006g1_1 [Lachancea nothofagi CBS 11611]|uniref:LANO_0H05006g1_1 n=1 Tax=Lachancea nothofagi CBS 11611 TaxID=1266666 RepID=A0A1G4KL90_9SACH|nr:LANO_0H05006g1_1 [Lachancea nothofagi CBS 11611]